MSISRCRSIEVPVHPDPRGKLAVVEPGTGVPFEIRRVYYLYDVPAGAKRGGHAHKELEQLIFAPAGSFDVGLDDGRNRTTVRLSSPNIGLYICPMVWRELSGFTSGAVCLVLASLLYDEADYYRDYDDFLRAATLA